MKDFTIENAIARIKSLGDLFKGTLEEGIDMEKAPAKAQSRFPIRTMYRRAETHAYSGAR